MRTLVTGGAGFIGSHLVDALVDEGHDVVVVDDLSNGLDANLNPNADVEIGSITDDDLIARAVHDVEVVFHLGALGAVPRSLHDPLRTDEVNVRGTLTVLHAACEAGVRRVVYASSSSVYGGATVLPTPESAPLRPRSPYAVSKLAAEWYCRVFAERFPIETVALRYFNVYGPRQRPDATYAAVIPLFTTALLRGEAPTVFGDGKQSRDFTYVGDVVAANLAAASAPASVSGSVFNVAPGTSHTLLELVDELRDILGVQIEPTFTRSAPAMSATAAPMPARPGASWDGSRASRSRGLGAVRGVGVAGGSLGDRAPLCYGRAERRHQPRAAESLLRSR